MSRPCVLPSAFCTASAPRTSCLSQLDGWPMHSPTDASPVPSQVPAHGSGPMRFATPSPWRTLTTYSLPVSPAHTKEQLPFKLSNDPEFAEKVVDIVGLYLNPPDNAVLSVDEKSQIQLLDRTQPGLPCP